MTQTARVPDDNLTSGYLQRFFAERPIGEQLPPISKAGEVLEMPTIRCQHCNTAVSETMVRGTARRVKPWLVSVQAGAFCARCQVISSIQIRLHSRGAIETLRNGVWTTREPSRVPRYRLVLADKSRSFVEKVRSACDVRRFVVGFAAKERKQ